MSDTYSRFPTDPVKIQPLIASGPTSDDLGAPIHEWEPSSSVPIHQDPTYFAPWGLATAIIALLGSFFVGWLLPVALVAIVVAIMAIRRPLENQAMARWALVLGLLATIYSSGWLLWATMQIERLG